MLVIKAIAVYDDVLWKILNKFVSFWKNSAKSYNISINIIIDMTILLMVGAKCNALSRYHVMDLLRMLVFFNYFHFFRKNVLTTTPKPYIMGVCFAKAERVFLRLVL